MAPVRGYYFPEAVTGAVDPARVERMLELGNRPPRSPDDVLRFMRSIADILPSYHHVTTGLMALSLRLGDCLNCDLNASMEVEVLEVPGDLSPLTYFHPLIRQSALMAPAPLGVILPPAVRCATREATVNHLRGRFGWMEAVRVSLLFQIDQEMEAGDIVIHGMGKAWGLLGPTDLALYRALRRGGLAAMAQAYSLFLTSEERQPMDDVAERIADELMEGGGATTPAWQPAMAEVMQELPHTTLDDVAERLLPWDRGLYSRADSAPLAPARKQEIEALLGRPVQTEDDIR